LKKNLEELRNRLKDESIPFSNLKKSQSSLSEKQSFVWDEDK
jgi:hypothetical protein